MQESKPLVRLCMVHNVTLNETTAPYGMPVSHMAAVSAAVLVADPKSGWKTHHEYQKVWDINKVFAGGSRMVAVYDAIDTSQETALFKEGNLLCNPEARPYMVTVEDIQEVWEEVHKKKRGKTPKVGRSKRYILRKRNRETAVPGSTQDAIASWKLIQDLETGEDDEYGSNLAGPSK